MNAALERWLGSRGIVLVLLALPAVWPVVPLFVWPDASVWADPLKYILLHFGFTASVLLVSVLMLTPLRVAFPRAAVVRILQKHRRRVGVASFVYAVLHVTSHFTYEGGFETFRTDWKKPFILVGLTAFSVLFLLAITSANRMVRVLGARRWKMLHRLAYVAAGLVVYHQISAKKLFPIEVVWVFGPLLVFQSLRVWRAVFPGQRSAARSRGALPANDFSPGRLDR